MHARNNHKVTHIICLYHFIISLQIYLIQCDHIIASFMHYIRSWWLMGYFAFDDDLARRECYQKMYLLSTHGVWHDCAWLICVRDSSSIFISYHDHTDLQVQRSNEEQFNRISKTDSCFMFSVGTDTFQATRNHQFKKLSIHVHPKTEALLAYNTGSSCCCLLSESCFIVVTTIRINWKRWKVRYSI